MNGKLRCSQRKCRELLSFPAFSEGGSTAIVFTESLSEITCKLHGLNFVVRFHDRTDMRVCMVVAGSRDIKESRFRAPGAFVVVDRLHGLCEFAVSVEAHGFDDDANGAEGAKLQNSKNFYFQKKVKTF